MKIRTGFVSNSSSASFAVVFKDSEENVLDYLLTSFCMFDLSRTELIDKITNEIKSDEKFVQASEGKGISRVLIEDINKRIQLCKKYIRRIENAVTDLEVVNIGLEYLKIDVQYDGSNNETRLEGWTTMWNNVDDLDEFMKLVVCQAVKDEKPIRIEVDKD